MSNSYRHMLQWFLFLCLSFGVVFAQEDDESGDGDDDDDIPEVTGTGDISCPEGQVWSAQWGMCISSPTSSSGGTGSSMPDTSINDSEYGESYPDCPQGYKMVDGECKMVLPDGVPEKCRVFYESMVKYPGEDLGELLVNCIMLEALKLVVNQKIDQICERIRTDPTVREDWEEHIMTGSVMVCGLGGFGAGAYIGGPAGAAVGAILGAGTCGFVAGAYNDDLIRIRCDQ